MKFSRLPRALVAAGATIGIVTAMATASASASTSVEYVNLGDSFSAGSGVLPLSPGFNPLCLQSTKNFSHDIAAAKGYSLTDVSCGGATTAHFSTPQYPGLAPQLDAVTASTDLVTLTIGGNDNNTFASAIIACGSAGIATFGFGSPCKTIYGEYFADQIRNKTYASLVEALKAVKAKAPSARVAISGYPWVVPTTEGCYPFLPVASGDIPYLRSLQATLNDAVERAAAATGATYIDQNVVSDGHDACKPAGVRWVEPAFGTTQFIPVHPNALGEQGMADQFVSVLGL